MPEPNRKLIDCMYEAAWYSIYMFKYGLDGQKVPARGTTQKNMIQERQGERLMGMAADNLGMLRESGECNHPARLSRD